MLRHRSEFTNCTVRPQTVSFAVISTSRLKTEGVMKKGMGSYLSRAWRFIQRSDRKQSIEIMPIPMKIGSNHHFVGFGRRKKNYISCSGGGLAVCLGGTLERGDDLFDNFGGCDHDRRKCYQSGCLKSTSRSSILNCQPLARLRLAAKQFIEMVSRRFA